MFIVPFIHRVIEQNSFKVNIIKILTVGGNELWEEEDNLNLDRDILNPNDIYNKTTHIKINKNTYLCEIDTIKTNINDFYNWQEIELDNKDTFCWRSYIYLTDDKGNCWLETPTSEMLSTYKIQDLLKMIVHRHI